MKDWHVSAIVLIGCAVVAAVVTAFTLWLLQDLQSVLAPDQYRQ